MGVKGKQHTQLRRRRSCTASPLQHAWAAIVAVLFATAIAVSALEEHSFTYVVPAAQEECFHFEAKAGQSMEIEMQVISGGNLDLDFRLEAPYGQVIDTASRRQDHMYEGTATSTGDYKVCLSNYFSHVTEKQVFLLIMTGLDEDEEPKTPTSEGHEEDGLTDSINVAINHIHKDLTKSITLQDHLRARELRHRETAKSNQYRVQFWSGIQILVIIVVAFLQIVAIQRFFNGNENKSTRTGF